LSVAPLDACGCCDPGEPATPEPIDNRPGLSAIAYRVGTFASFREAMLEKLARELPELTTRAGDDHAITLLELWAAVGDVLTFYQERIANEAFLRTAVHQDSVRRLAALIDYRPRPGLSAEADIAFTLDEGASVTLPVGLRLMSLPGADEQPQTFETLEPCAAEAALNRLPARPVPLVDEPLTAGRVSVVAETNAPALAAGNRVALFTTTQLVEAGVAEVRAEDDARLVTWTVPLAATLAGGRARRIVRPLRFFGWNAPDKYPYYDPGVFDAVAKQWTRPPLWTELATTPLDLKATGPWPLEARIERLGLGATLLVVHDGVIELATVTSVGEAVASLGPLSDTVTTVTVTGASVIADRRTARVFEVEAAELALRRWNRPADLTGGRIALRPAPEGAIEPKRRILLDDGHGRVHAATVTGTALLPGFPDHLAVDFSPALPVPMAAKDAVVLGNVARAGHGETQHEEVLGDGDGGRAFQSFVPSKAPVTRRPSALDVRGTAALDVLVDGVRWSEVESLYGVAPAARVYTLRSEEDGKVRIGFGDGRTGARLPSGRGNVVARYRKGLGLAGLVKAGQLNILLTRPPGLREAINPAPAEAAADPEPLAMARANAPSSVLTFGRIVAIDDFAVLATASGEIAKARAAWVWRGLDRVIHLTVAAQGGGDLSPVALARLHAALDHARDPNDALLLANALRVPVTIRANLVVAPDRERDAVRGAARTALLDRLSFHQAELGRALHASQVITTLQLVPGVLGVDLDVLHFRDAASWSPPQLTARGATSRPDQPHLRLFAARARKAAAGDPIAQPVLTAGAEVVPAEIATLADADLVLTVSGGFG
jgi:hypothetical protein